MRYLENAFRFTFKNFLITLPLLISMAIPAFILSLGSISFLSNLGNMQQIIQDMVNGGSIDYSHLMNELYGPTMLVSMIVSGILSLIFSILVYPITYGLINKKYETGKATFSDMTESLSKFIGRYVLYMLLIFAIGLGLGLVLLILLAITSVIMIQVNTALGILLMVLFVLAFIVGGYALKMYMSLWFPAVCIENSGIIDGLKNSFRTVKGSFWPILGITLLISLCGSVAGMMLGWFPVIGSVISSVTSTLAEFITIVFYFEIYRAKTGRFDVPETFEQIDGGVQ